MSGEDPFAGLLRRGSLWPEAGVAMGWRRGGTARKRRYNGTYTENRLISAHRAARIWQWGFLPRAPPSYGRCMSIPSHAAPAPPQGGEEHSVHEGQVPPWHGPEADEVLMRAARESGAHITVFYVLPEGEPVLVMDAEVGLPGQIAKPWARMRLSSGSPASASARQRRLIWVPGHQELARRFPAIALAAPYAFAIAAAPIITGTRLWGAMLFLWPPSHPSDLAPHELEAISSACDRMGALLRETVGEDRPLHRTGEPRIVTPMAPRVPEQHPASAVCDYLDRLRVGCLAMDLECRITFVSAAAADLLDAHASDLVGRPLWEAAPWLKDPLFEDRCRAAVVSQEMTSYVARGPDGSIMKFRLYPDPAGISLRISPVDVEDPVADGLPGQALLSRAEVSYGFLPLAVALSRALNVPEIVDLVADHVMPVFKAKAMAIMKVEGRRMRIVGSRGYPHDVIERFEGMPVSTCLPAEDVARTGEPLFFADWDELRERYPHAVHYDRMSAWAFLPLTVYDEVIGACVLAFGESHPFTVEERATFTALAGLVAHSLDRAMRYDTKDRLAHSLQKALLPRSLPEIPGLEVAAWYVPATRGVGIGGDFYDLIRLTDTSAAAVIGDVQGHNMTAAALMGQVRTAIHANAVAGASPGDVLKHTNRLLIDVDTELFTSCLLIHVDLQLRTLRAATAGHPPPLLRPPNMPAEIIDVPAGLLLGVDPDAEYPTLQVPFPPGALLALYTDGLVETPGTDLDRAIAALAGNFTRDFQDLGELGGSLIAHAPHTGERADDIALLLLEHRCKSSG
ncbi:SpoIIE family protein phosphatase [Nonomuraea phyllanthi]|nr:SpoIIE family protein phosphatase [Nonomuraea phyllanthi]